MMRMIGLESLNFGQVATFLFMPETFLSVFFLLVFIVLLAFGVWIYMQCTVDLRKLDSDAEEMYEPLGKKISPNAFLRAELEKISPKEGIMEGIPDAFVSIGILATFIGLGIALQDATEQLATLDKIGDENLKALHEMLNVMAFKFQTSVWGIFFSLLFKRFVVEAYFAYRQEIVDDVRERLYAHVRDGIRTLLEKQNDVLKRQFEYQQSIDTERRLQVEQLTQAFRDKYSETVELFSTKMQEILAAQNDAHADLVTQLDKNHRETLALSSKIHTEQLAGLSNIEQAIRQSDQSMQQSVQNLEQTVQQSMQAILQSDQATQELLRQQLDETSGIHREFGDFVSTSKDFTAAAAQFTQTSQTFADHVDEYRLEVAAFKDNLTRTIDSAFGKQDALLEEVGRKQFDTLCVMKTGIEDMQRIFLRDEDRFVEEIRGKLSKMLTDTGNAFKATLDHSIDKVSGDYNAVLESFNEKFDAGIKQAHADYTHEIQHFGEVARSLSKAIDNVNDNIGKLRAASAASQQQLDGITAASQKQLDKVTAISQKQLDLITDASQKQLEDMTAIFNRTHALIKDMNAAIASMKKLVEVTSSDISREEMNQRLAAQYSLQNDNNAKMYKNIVAWQNQIAKEIRNSQVLITNELKYTRARLEKFPSLQDWTEALTKTLASTGDKK